VLYVTLKQERKMSNDLQYVYQKERKEFGKQCLFSDKKFLMVSIPSNHDEFNDYILRNPVEEGTQLNKQFALSEVGRAHKNIGQS
jgi:dynein intermediate chain 2, axonemal